MPRGNWIFERMGAGAGGGLVIGFVINDGSAGDNIGPMLPAPRSGSVTRCVVVIKMPDAADLKFTIRKNDTPIFAADLTLPAASAVGDLLIFASFTASPFPVSLDDVFSIDIIKGSAPWKFTVQLA